MDPRLYHAHHGQNLEDLPFWLDLAQNAKGPILELGCGSGRILAALLESGEHVYGLDNDFGMLHFLCNNLPPAARRRAQVVQADFRRFRLALEFDAIIMPCNTYSTLSHKDRRQTLACVRRQLAPGGVFAAGMPNPTLLMDLPPHSEPEIEAIIEHPTSAEPVQISSAWQRDHQFFSIQWGYDHLKADGTVERTAASTRHYLTTLETTRDELHSNGFSTVSLLGDYDGSAYHSDSNYLIFVAQG